MDITLQLPNGKSFRAVAVDDSEYPSISIYLIGTDGAEEIICFSEFNSEKPEGEEICIGVYSPSVDECVYYSSYKEGTNEKA